ncbi:eukaryotic translation initiation factor 4B1-like [Selaginella moellendorffii]|uniref:eukaryotic translation initiation factor 4B1-like n=1 Tax=Selaginella moellendorffii TaxID=88036 RepID=UPI000D1C581A|nr:eukaryotic translation initiation factor 4B1-like [Selaginella moellendorffii]|eukprot:XP_024542767.1 eukaryotic translation initiation factor 4B1-like [Selaginella moellendorffii]
MARPWGKVGAWADDSEAEAAAAAAPTAPPPAAPLPVEAFPSLGEAAAAKSSKKKKGQTLTFAEFQSGKYVPGVKQRSSASSGIFTDSDRLTSDEMMMLPTGPKDRSDEEPYEQGGRLGGGFRDYGGFRGDRDRGDRDRGDRGDRERDQRGFGFDREREASRADDSSDWSSNKPSRGAGGGGGGRFDDENRRYSGDRFGGDRDLPSKADEVDNWASGKKSLPPPERRSDDIGRRSDDFGKGGFGKADADDNWGANKKPVVSDKWSFRRSDDYGGPDSGDKWSRRSNDDSPGDDKWGARKAGDEAPRRPRLNLRPRTLPLENSPPPVSADQQHGSRPSSSHSSRPGSPPEVEAPPVEPKPRQKVDPFGNAKPREVLLEQRGQDWRKMDMELESKRPDTDEEKKLKEEIVSLKELADSTADPAVKEQLAEKEQELEQLVKELHSKARVSSDRWRKDESRITSPPATRRDPWKRENGRDRPKVDRW